MSKYGINVPKGVAVSSVQEVKEAVKTAFPNQSEVKRNTLDYKLWKLRDSSIRFDLKL